MQELKVLIIDSNNNFSRIAKSFLLAKYLVTEVETSTDSAEVLQALDKFEPELLLVDEILLRDGSIRPGFLSLLKDKLPFAKIFLMVLYPQTYSFNDFPWIEHFSGRISKQDFAMDIIVLINSCFNRSAKD